MPKKYHRPPTTKRRKSKKTTSPNVLEPLPESQTDNTSTAPLNEEDGDETAAPVAVDEDVDEKEEYEVAPVPGMAKKVREARHLAADYSYVLTEVRLSIGLAIFLIAALIITGILR